MIHIDSGTMLYHLKALTVEDYNDWTKAIKTFKNAEQRAAAQDTVHRMTQRDSNQKRAYLRNSWVGTSGGNSNDLDQLKELMSAMDAGFLEIKDQLDSIRVQSESSSPVSSSHSQRSPTQRERQSSVDNNSPPNNKFKINKFIPSLQRSKSACDLPLSQSVKEELYQVANMPRSLYLCSHER